MTMETFHPDQLKSGQMVGPWRIVESLGSGNFGHAFKAERDGDFFTLKMAVRPAPGLSRDAPDKTRDDRQVEGRMRREAAILMANASHPGLPHLRAMDRWPHATRGYLYLVTDHVEGEAFHAWRERTRPTVAQMVDIFIEVVRTLVPLHKHGVLIRDFKSEHVIVTAPDHKPVMVDLGSARLPGASTLTVGLAPGTPAMLPPECVTFLREGTWKQGARLDVSAAADLYQVGVFMYEALTECWPFDARLTQDELLTAIQTVIPRAPHRLNPEVPESLSRITQRLLEKRPEDRYASAEALLQALWDAAKERTKRAWKVQLKLPPEGAAPVTQDEVEERRLHQQEAERRAQEARKQQEEELAQEGAFEDLSATILELGAEVSDAREQTARRKKWRRRIAVASVLLPLGLALFVTSEKGSSLVSTLSKSWPVKRAAIWLCATFTVGCPAAQVRPPQADCPVDVVEGMRKMGIFNGNTNAQLDINQPEGSGEEPGTYRAGPIISKVMEGRNQPLPVGTLLYGQLWTEGITKRGRDAVLGRWNEALLPDGRRVPVCFVLFDPTGLVYKEEGSKPGQAALWKVWRLEPTEFWP